MIASIIAYIVTSIIYFFKSKQEDKEKIKNIIKWQIITAIVIVILLLFAKNW